MATNSAMAQIERLSGRENYTTWSFAVKTYLQHEDLWKCIEDDEQKVDSKEDIKARSKIILLVDPVIYVHVQEAKTAKQVWSNLQKAFDDSGLTRRVGLLRELITTDLEGCGNVENYVNKVITCAHKLRNIGFSVDDEWLGTLLLAGLPETYKPMIMAMESSGVKISTDLVKTKILQDVKNVDDSSAFYSHAKSKNAGFKPQKKGPRCFKCNKYGHISKNCFFNRGSSQRKNKTNDTDGFTAAFCVSPGLDDGCWYVDSGAAMHMTRNKNWMYDYGPSTISSIRVADNKTLKVEGCGKVNIHLPSCENNGQKQMIQVKNVLYVPDLAVNLLSVQQMTKSNCQVKFFKGCCKIYQNNKLILTAYAHNNMYVINNDAYALLSSAHLWHQRMGHLNYKDLQMIKESTEGVQSDMNVKENGKCTTCLQGKQTRQPFKQTGTRASALLEVIHSDVCGPMEEKSIGGARYYVSFIDDYSRKVFVYFMHSKSQVFEKFKEFKSLVENQLNGKIKILRSDNGKEYANEAFDKLCKNAGIKRQFTVPYTPEHNGMSERMNRTLVERAKCMLINSQMPKKFWAEAVSTAAYVINRTPTKSLKYKTPEEMWTGIKPNISNMRVFGCDAMMHIPKEKRLKWDCKSKKLKFVGYCLESKGYRLYDKESGKIVRSRDVVFLEGSVKNDFVLMPLNENEIHIEKENDELNTSMQSCISTEESDDTIKNADSLISEDESDKDDKNDKDDEYVPDESLNETIEPKQINLRPRKNKTIKPTYLCQSQENYSSRNEPDPETVEQAMASKNSQEWIKAMDSEYNSLIENNTWTLADLPSNKKVIPCKWVFKTKEDADGNIVRFKARLVIKGYVQKPGVDYTDVYAPVARLTSIRYLLGVAAKYCLKIEQLDAVTAFLQGDIDVELYMAQPPSYENGTQVCKLNKSIYGLKQASRTWNMKLNNFLLNIGFKQSKMDPCVYYKCEDKNILFMTVFVDDLLLFFHCQEQANQIKKQMMENFKMKELGRANQYIGLRITYNEEGIGIDQTKYISDVLKRFGMENCNPVGTPMETNLKFSNDENNETDEGQNIPYQEAIGCLLYISLGTRPDISFAVHKLSRYNQSPTAEHWNCVKRLFRYLQGTKDLQLFYSTQIDEEIKGYSDADWASCPEDRKSCTGYVFMYQGGAISWNSRRQQTVALSTTEAEYMAMSTATQEALWLRQLHLELWPSLKSTPMTLYCDNQSAIKLAGTANFQPRSKHIDIRHHYIRDKVSSGEIYIEFIPSDSMTADCLTKALPKPNHQRCLKDMGLRIRSREDIGN